MINRYTKQIIFPGIREVGQEKLDKSNVVIIGCGALGGIISTILVRAGVGHVKIIDRDFIEYRNLHRQVLFNEKDIKSNLPKAVAAERHLKKVNSSIQIEGIVADVNYSNIETLVHGADLILDGSDNAETRFLINDVSLKHKIPWIYGGVIAATGMTMTIIPGITPCLRCVWNNLSDHEPARTSDNAGLIAPAPFIIGSLQSTEAIKILVGAEDINRDLILVDAWQGDFKHIKIVRHIGCPACSGKFDFLKPNGKNKITSV